jgi:hypothetical protein
MFSGEWRESDDGVWRLTSYARNQRRRRERGVPTASAFATGNGYRRSWAEPATWGSVVGALPCRVECPGCGETQVILARGSGE